MEYRVLRESDMNISNWTGGKTKQLAIYPENGSYLDREFIWRLSSATVEQEESDFSKLPDFNRVLMVLEGDVVLAHQDVRVARLKQYEQDRFDGAYKTKSFGKITDYNLMTKKGCEGFLTYIALSSDPKAVEYTQVGSFQKNSFGFYCAEGYGVVTINGEQVMVGKGEQLVIDGETDEEYKITLMGEGSLIQAEIYYNTTADEFAPTIIPKEPTSFDDVKQCLYLANSQFRGARLIFKRKRDEWLDEELKRSVDILEKTCATMIVFVLGVCAVLLLSYKSCSDLEMIGLCGLWLIFDSIFISPLLYLAAVPKPVSKHIKKISELTPYEKKKMQEEAEFNPRIQHILDNSITGNKDFQGASSYFKIKKK